MKLNHDLRRVLFGALVLAAFVLGMIVGATIEQTIERTAAAEVRR
jgi:hypothetical protein